MRTCEICGARISITAGVCEKCGTTYAAEGEVDSTIYNQPRWGAIIVNFSKCSGKERELIFDQARDRWIALERDTSQKLFSGQFTGKSTGGEVLELYGPYTSFLELKILLAPTNQHDDLVSFTDLPLTEIYRIRDGSNRG